MLSRPPWRNLRWMVLAPHADDETLGAGALIAQLAAARQFSGLVYLTDGSASHQLSPKETAHLVQIRRREAALALFRLTQSRQYPPLHLGWKDAAPAAATSSIFAQTVFKLAAFCRQHQIDAIAVTALHEPHCDHQAAAELAYAVQRCAKRRILVAEYIVWAEKPCSKIWRRLQTKPMPLGQRRHALRAHRSQTSAAYGRGFRLPRNLLKMPASDQLFIRKSK